MTESELKQLWKNQPASAGPMEMAKLQSRARRFQRSVRIRNALEYTAGIFVIAGFLSYAWNLPGTLMRVGSVLVALGVVFVLVQLHRRASGSAPAAQDQGLACIEFHRAQLVRQRDALRSVWRWYIGPMVPGVVVFRWGVETELTNSQMFARGMGANLLIAGIFLAVILINVWSAHRLQKRIDELDK